MCSVMYTVQGDMKDLSAFDDEYFDFIIHPWSNGYVETVLPVWNECSRVLKKNGTLIAGFKLSIHKFLMKILTY